MGCEHAEGAVQASVIVPVNPCGGGEFDILAGFVGAVVEHVGVHTFGFVDPVDGLHQSVVIRIADRADRRCDALEVQMLGVTDPHSPWQRPTSTPAYRSPQRARTPLAADHARRCQCDIDTRCPRPPDGYRRTDAPCDQRSTATTARSVPTDHHSTPGTETALSSPHQTAANHTRSMGDTP